MSPVLIQPSAEFEASYREYIRELGDEERYPFPLDFDHSDFAALLQCLGDLEAGRHLPPGYVPSSTYWLVEGAEIVGVSNLRHTLNEKIRWCGGHIGLGVRPSRRGRGLGAELMKLTIHEAWKRGIEEIHIHCYKSNPASARIIEANGGVLQSEIENEAAEKIVQRFVVHGSIGAQKPNTMHFAIRATAQSDLVAISQLAMAAFGSSEGPEIVQLIAGLLDDVTAQPVLSLVACVDERVAGYILFSRAMIKPSGTDVSAALLAPLAVHPAFQSQGIGGELVAEGLQRLSETGVDLVFVLGHPAYYPRFGFCPAEVRGFKAPHPIPPRNAEAWMVRELSPGIIGYSAGQVICAESITDEKYWRE